MNAEPSRKLSAIFSFLQRLVPLFAVVVFGLAVYFVHKILKPYTYREIMGYVEAIPLPRFAAAVGVTAASYALLCGYDLLAVRYVGRRLPTLRVVFAAFMAFAFSNTIGLANLAGSSVRLRLYPSFGLDPRDVLRMIAFISVSFWLGFFALAGFVLTVHPVDLPDSYGLPGGFLRGVGCLLLAVVGGYLALVAFRREPLRFGGHHVKLPSFGISVLQILVAAGDWALAGAALFFLLPASPTLGYFHFLSIFLSAQLAALLSHVPAGAGVLEALITQFVSPEHQSTPAIVGGLIAFRLVYYLGPLLLATVALGFFEIYRQRSRVQTVSKTALRFTSQIAPPAAAMLVFLAGAVLLFSGASPAERDRLDLLRHHVPLVLVEISHFAGSAVGMALLVVARGLLSRSNAAWLVTMFLLALGAVFSLAKGFDYEEALLLGFFFLFLLASRREFYRPSRLLSEPLSRSWVASILIVLAFATWLGFFTNKHVDYSNELWWRFTFHGDASRFLRAMVGVGGTAAALALLRLLSPRSTPREIPSVPVEEILPLVQAASDTLPNLALLGDKKLFANEARDAFLMYAIRGSTWAVLGDPVGNRDAFSDLLYDFKHAADGYGGGVAFYQVHPENLPFYIDLGMIFVKLGEEAHVPLKDFALEGRSRKSLRQQYNRTVKAQNLRFEIVPAEGFAAIEGELRAVSDAWLETKGTREKGFSLGYYDPIYLGRYPTAVLRDDAGRIQAFANLWTGANHEELSVDLMRYRPEVGAGVMERLMIDLMLWGRDQGYQNFNLGMAPLAGLDTGRLGSRWNRAGRLLFQHGERFYNFQGLRAFKDKFDPEWEPRYLAYSGKLQLPKILADLAVLIAGGVKGMVTK